MLREESDFPAAASVCSLPKFFTRLLDSTSLMGSNHLRETPAVCSKGIILASPRSIDLPTRVGNVCFCHCDLWFCRSAWNFLNTWCSQSINRRSHSHTKNPKTMFLCCCCCSLFSSPHCLLIYTVKTTLYTVKTNCCLVFTDSLAVSLKCKCYIYGPHTYCRGFIFLFVVCFWQFDSISF